MDGGSFASQPGNLRCQAQGVVAESAGAQLNALARASILKKSATSAQAARTPSAAARPAQRLRPGRTPWQRSS